MTPPHPPARTATRTIGSQPRNLSSHLKAENTILPRMIRSTLTAVIVALFAVEATAEVTRVDVAKRADVGASGYEKIVGTIHFAIDPKDPGNQVIVGLDKAPRNASGKVEFSADLYILQPRDATRVRTASRWSTSSTAAAR